MKAWEAHQALASAIGDPIEVDTIGGVIPDGVRYSKIVRSNYIDRGINHVLSTFINQIQISRIDDKSAMVYGLFPTFTRNNTILTPNFTPDTESTYSLPSSLVTAESKAPLLIMDASYVYYYQSIPTMTTREQLPMLSVNQYNQLIARRFNEDFYADTVAVYYGAGNGLRVYNSRNIDQTTPPDELEINYLPQPKEMEDHAWDDDVDFETMYVSRVLYQASLYAMGDSGDVNLQAMTQSIAPLLGGISGGNNG